MYIRVQIFFSFHYCCGRLSVISCEMVDEFHYSCFQNHLSNLFSCGVGWHHVSARKHYRPRVSVCFFQNWIRKLWILSTVDRVFYPLVLYALYLTVGKSFIMPHVTLPHSYDLRKKLAAPAFFETFPVR
jgi:hypothetical protein